jgi:hypothetical protein
MTGRVSTDSGLALTLHGDWPSSVTVRIDGAAVPVQQSSGAIEVSVPAGQHTISIRPA